MQKYFKIPFYFLLVASIIGLLLRFHLVMPLQSLVYTNWLHTHSHLMFLGWLFNFFNLALIFLFLPELWTKKFRLIFIINQALLIGMFFFFPLQGYGPVTIPLSTAHTLVSALFCLRFITYTRNDKSPSRWFACWSLIFFLVSSLGPFALAPIMANHLGHSKWYYFAVYFYLHFQYNGLFFFGVVALFVKRLELSNINMFSQWKTYASWLVVSTFATYLLSILWAEPGLVFNGIGFLFAVLQAIVFFRLLSWVQSCKSLFKQSIQVFYKLSAVAFGLKFMLQVVSADPHIVQFTYENRYVVIAYLHLVLIGGVTFFVLGWNVQQDLIRRPAKLFFWLLIGGFTLSECSLVMVTFVPIIATIGSSLILIFSAIMFVGIAGYFLNLSSKS